MSQLKLDTEIYHDGQGTYGDIVKTVADIDGIDFVSIDFRVPSSHSYPRLIVFGSVFAFQELARAWGFKGIAEFRAQYEDDIVFA